MGKAKDDPLELVPSRYEAWRESFTTERNQIRDVLTAHSLYGHVERIEHVGSTAVPDLAAKDIVDLDIVVTDKAVADVSQRIEGDLDGNRVENSEQWHPVFRKEDG